MTDQEYLALKTSLPQLPPEPEGRETVSLPGMTDLIALKLELLFAQIDGFGDLRHNWDSYGAEAPSLACQRDAKAVLQAVADRAGWLFQSWSGTIKVSPIPSGIVVIWKKDEVSGWGEFSVFLQDGVKPRWHQLDPDVPRQYSYDYQMGLQDHSRISAWLHDHSKAGDLPGTLEPWIEEVFMRFIYPVKPWLADHDGEGFE
jgi:hypothetical protein